MVHRWAGLFTALFLLIAGVTGSVLAFRVELDEWVNAGWFVVSPPAGHAEDAFLDALVLRERVQAQFPRARVDYLSFPTPGRPQVFFLTARADPTTGKRYPLSVDEAFFDPYTGRFLGARKWGELFTSAGVHVENIVPFVWRLHEALNIPAPWGKGFMGLVAVIWTLDCFVGLALTLPHGRPWWRKWWVAFRIKRGASPARQVFDWHRAGGLWAWLTLLFFAWSAVMLNTGEFVYQPVMSLVFRFEDDRPPELRAPKLTPRLGWQDARERGKRALERLARDGGFSVGAEDSLGYRPKLGAYLYRARTSLDIRDNRGGSDVWLDGDTGAVLQVHHESRGASGNVLSTWIRVLHTGHVGGLPYRLLLVVVGLIIAMLSVTGVLIWRRKWRNPARLRPRHRLAARRAEEVARPHPLGRPVKNRRVTRTR